MGWQVVVGLRGTAGHGAWIELQAQFRHAKKKPVRAPASDGYWFT
ncbi:MAG: hypothetical protein ABSD64_14225 [Terriglobales bacterium]